ncbi:MAG: dipeptidyl aminopeptidase/acylaminoacyl peptidase [Polyangiales bacterium]|jgi:dipeptidyl aminopeptidase/acylaminoacyl peptidase
MFNTDSLLALRRVQGMDFSTASNDLIAEVGRVADDESKFVTDLWRVPMDGGPAAALTSGEHSDNAPQCLDDGSVLFLSTRPLPKRSENKAPQLWRLPPQGEPKALTDEAQGVISFAASKSGKRIVIATARYPGDVDQHAHHDQLSKAGPSIRHYKTMPARHWDHWRGAPIHLVFIDEEEESHDLTPHAELEHLDSAFALSPSGDTLAAVRGRRVGRMRYDELWIRDPKSVDERVLEFDETRLSNLLFNPSGTHLAAAVGVRRDGAAEACYSISIEVASGESVRLAKDLDRAPVPLTWLDDTTLVAAADDESRRPLFALSLDGSVERLADGHFVAACVSGEGIFALGSTMKSPPFIGRISNGKVEPLAELSGIADTDAPDFRIEDVRVPLSDGESMQGLVAWPSTPGPHPLLLWIHGGPIGQFADQWHWRWNVAPFVAAGFAVAIPNARGSTGRGDAFMSAIYRDWGGRVHQDLIEYAAVLCARDDIDGAFAMGGSFGGYMTNWIGANPDPRVPFKALVTHASLYDLRAFYGATDYPADFGDFIGGAPWDGKEDGNFERHSPHKNIAQWKAPTLILHGEKDYRVPIGEGLALFEALQAHGVESELAVFPDEGHWITRPRNVRAWYETVLTFLAKHR